MEDARAVLAAVTGVARDGRVDVMKNRRAALATPGSLGVGTGDERAIPARGPALRRRLSAEGSVDVSSAEGRR